MSTNRKPAFAAYCVTGEGDNAFWTRIGAAWHHSNGDGLNIELQALPTNGRIVLLPPKPEPAPEAPAAATSKKGA